MNDRQYISEAIPGSPASNQEVFQSGNFGDLLNTLISRKLDEEQRRVLSSIASNYEKALAEARKNDLELANASIADAEQAGAHFPLNSLTAQLLGLHALPVKAYFYYKKYEYQLAERLLMESIAGCNPLIEQGFFMVECHRVQQLHNLARMYFKRKQFEHGSWIISEALNYLAQERIPQLGSDWSIDALRQTPYSLRSDMILQLALETAGELLPPTQQQDTLHQSAFGNSLDLVPGLAACEPLSRWIKLKNMLLSGMPDESFVTSAVDFITTTPARFDILKLALMVNVTDILRKTFNYDSSVYENLVSYGKRLKVSQKHKLACFTYIEP
ncbi:hypothetical protein LZD49_17415 [Dyadobacter sp. CY261]|uniref:hypothetical protein n=1 Tax=Dyadobacter sp. CY261 TaxID=2907203 RepID=UPI001F2F5ADB|nr:hypothetical protein [Dyadobacter sp. CY261]MCF0072263.1 hypothetical protein [Dyadobacter sp. CY261]